MKNIRQNVKEQIHDWLLSINFSATNLKDILLKSTSNREDKKKLDEIQNIFNQLALVKSVKNGRTTIHGFDQRIKRIKK